MRTQIAPPARLLLVVLLAAACPGRQPPVQEDVEAYLRQLGAWAPQEAEAARAIARILRTQFVDEAEVRRQIAESRPRVDAQIAALAAYRPRTRELAQVHEEYVRTWRALRRGYDDILQGMDRADQTALARGRKALVDWRHGVVATARRVRELREAGT